jgi:hypothetical protein
MYCLHLCPIFNSDNLLLLYHFQNIIGSCQCGALWWCSSEFVSRTKSTKLIVVPTQIKYIPL